MSNIISPKGEMNEAVLVDVASILMPDFHWESQKRFNYDPSNRRKYYQADCVSIDAKVVIEYEGPNHYCDVWKNRRDNERLSFFEFQGFTFLRWPYYCQLTRALAKHFFGECDDNAYLNCISHVYGVDHAERILACGFHNTRNTPSNYTYLGIERFLAELSEFPVVVKTQVAESLRRYCRAEHCVEIVIGKDRRLLDLLKFEGSPQDLKAFYHRQP
jgi:hypothetical protein